jgi:presenilin-like A22 family membrane protease
VRVGVGDEEEGGDGEGLEVGVGEAAVASYLVIPQDAFTIEKPIKAVSVADSIKAIKICLSFLFILRMVLFGTMIAGLINRYSNFEN